MSGLVVTRAGAGASTGVHDADPVRTEVVRHGLASAANQMKRALVRTAFSPIIYEVLDFAVALYDRDVRMLAQAPSLPLFMGRLSFCVENAVAAVGGECVIEPGDVILYNHPFGTGSHPQDAALVMPVFLHDEQLVGYAAVKAHWLDIGGKEPYATDTVDMFQEGTISRRQARQPRAVVATSTASRSRTRASRSRRRRHQRGARFRAHRRRGDAAGHRALRPRRSSASASSTCSITASRSCARGSSGSPTGDTSDAERSTTTVSATS